MTGPALASLLPLPVALPIAGAVAAPLLARLHRQLALVAGLVALGGGQSVASNKPRQSRLVGPVQG